MAQKTKVTITRTAREKFKKENAKRARDMREKRGKKTEKNNEYGRREEGKSTDSQEQKDKEDKGLVKKMRRGLKALKEIKKYQSGTKLPIRRLPFQRVV